MTDKDDERDERLFGPDVLVYDPDTGRKLMIEAKPFRGEGPFIALTSSASANAALAFLKTVEWEKPEDETMYRLALIRVGNASESELKVWETMLAHTGRNKVPSDFDPQLPLESLKTAITLVRGDRKRQSDENKQWWDTFWTRLGILIGFVITNGMIFLQWWYPN